jgi:[ribosomal protein S5]-alanine N-acetyltransferase
LCCARPSHDPDVVNVLLVAPDLELLDAAIAGREQLSRALGCKVAEGWNVFGGAVRRTRDALARDPGSARWGMRLFVQDHPPALIGFGGFKGPPNDGVVELGYAIAPSHEGRGLATAAARAMVREAFADPGVRTVIAHTKPEPGASTRVLEKLGFTAEGEVPDKQIGTSWRFRIDRSH